MKILQISDTHLGITRATVIEDMLLRASAQEFDLIVHCGDWCGTYTGWEPIQATLPIIRKVFPDKPILATLGNHDYWTYARSLSSFAENLHNIRASFKEHGVHYLDKDGLWEKDGVVIIGAGGWYATRVPRTNDNNFLPYGLGGDTHLCLLTNTEADLAENEKGLAGWDGSKTLVFVSHFPVINTGDDYKGAFEEFSWSERIGEHYQEEYGCRYFLNGHAHQLHAGPLRYECGSDYYVPAFQIIEIRSNPIWP